LQPSKSDKTLEKVIASLEEDSKALINCFSVNKMQANPEKFQAISLGKKTHDKNIIFNLDGISIVCDDEVKRLGDYHYVSPILYTCRDI
jgi:hypothetical protein